MNYTYIKYISLSSVFLLFLAINFISFAQNSEIDFTNYTPLEAKGKIPDAFLKRTSDFYEAKRGKNVITIDKNLEENKDKFDVISSFHLNQLLWSGSVLFGDTITTYVQAVGNKVLENYPDLQGKVHFYVTKEHAVNAFTTPEGFIFINLGLLAHLENEAQLAYILSHEITHFTKKHSINQFLYEREVEDENKGIAGWFSKSKSLYEKQAQKSSYSKEQEIEADDYGWEIFSKTSYDLSEAVAAFSALENSRYPFDTLVFESKFLNNSYVNLPDSFYYRDITDFVKMPELSKKDIEKIKTLQTHPDIEERIKIALIKMASKAANKGEKYLVSEERFKLAQKIARFELCNLYLQEEQFVDAIYTALILESQYGKSKYSELCIVKALYGWAIYEISKKEIYLEYPYQKMDWKGRNWIYALEELNADQIAVLAASHLMEFADKYKEYEYLYYFIPKLFFEERIQITKQESNYPYRTSTERNYNVSLRKLLDMGLMQETWKRIKMNQKVSDIGLLDEEKGLERGLAKLFELGALEENNTKQQIDREFKDYTKRDINRVNFKRLPGESSFTPHIILTKKMFLISPILVQIGKKRRKKSFVDFFLEEQYDKKELTDIVQKYNAMRKEESRFSVVSPDAFKIQDIDKYNIFANLDYLLGSFYDGEVVQEMKLTDLPQLKKLQKKYDIEYSARILVLLDRDDYTIYMQVQNLKNGLITKELIRTGRSDKKDSWQQTFKELFVD